MLKYITSYTLQNFRIAGCLFVFSCLLTSAGQAQGWIVPLGKGKSLALEVGLGENYLVGLKRNGNSVLIKINQYGVIEDSIQLATELIDLKRINQNIYMLTYSSPLQKAAFYRVNENLYLDSIISVGAGGSILDTFYFSIVSGSKELMACGNEQNNISCNKLYEIDTIGGTISDYLTCFGSYQSFDGKRYWEWNDRYLTTTGESKWVYAKIGSSTVDTAIIGNCNKFLHPSQNGNYMGGLSGAFKLVDTNFQIVNTLTDADLSYANAPNTQIRDGLCSASDGGFYYAAHYNNWSFPTIYLGKIDALGNHAWIRAYPEYIFATVKGLVEAVEADGAVMLVEDEYYTSENTNLYLMKTAADGTIGVKENTLATFQIYPNPAQESIQILSSIPGDYILTIFNVLGQEMRTQFLTESHALIDISSFPVGIYTLQLVQDNQTRFSKFIKA